MKKLFLIYLLGLILQGCVKETRVETKVIPESRQAEAQISQSFKNQGHSSNIIEIKKSALGKAYLLVASFRTAERSPQWQDVKPVLVSFEQSGSRLGLFRLSYANLYEEIPTDKLIQTFEIIDESKDSLSFDFGKGFISLPSGPPFDIMINHEDFKKDVDRLNSGEESSLKIKDSFVRSINISDEKFVIEQSARILNEKLVENKVDGLTAKKQLQLEQKEIPVTFNLELKPYIKNENFVPLIFDREQRIGAFTMLSPVSGEENPRLYAMKWDLSDEKGPIALGISKNVPPELVPVIIEAGEYWNRVIGKKVFTPKLDMDPGQLPEDRMILVRWIPWETAGFAYASMQADPITGEILRGQIFLTSSWYLRGSKIVSEDYKFQQPEEQKQLITKYALCVMDQASFKEDFLLEKSPNEVQKRASFDTIRLVVAHEMGHAIGMRHNFVGSFNSPTPDKEAMSLMASYLKDFTAAAKPLSTTVMDYTQSVATAINGSWIKSETFPYDQAFVKWAYLGQKIEIEKNNYCSDEHILAADQHKQV
ncbi:MAG: zinc-dependent metalloprotease, partial [Bdellovibrionales bacterium]|nr:zinc-dependent metalloprotease [Bdellovibrionales bacterium]